MFQIVNIIFLILILW